MWHCLSLPLMAATVPERLVQAQAMAQEGFDHPHDLVVSDDGKWLYVADMNNDEIKVLDARTLQLVNRIGSGELSSPHDVVLLEGEQMLVADSGHDRIVLYFLRGNGGELGRVLFEGLANPEGITHDGHGVFYISNTARHSVIRVAKGRREEKGKYGHDTMGYERPHDIEFHNGKIYVADPGNGRLKILDQELNLVEIVGGSGFNFKEPKYFALSDNSWIYVADQHNNCIKIIDHEHRLQRVLPGFFLNDKQYAFDRPEGVAIKGNILWVADTYNNRVVRLLLP